jgi:4-aminobutyrate aminotransferase-like enzyme/Ser/Thr protein kinase RdoA (MazF antagonist)
METLAASVAARRPRFDADDASRIAGELWGLKAIAQELPSERDQNFFLVDEADQRFVLKIANAAERREILDLQLCALEHLSGAGLPYHFPIARPTEADQPIATVASPAGETHLVRLLTYVPGRPLAQRVRSPDLLAELGHFLGALDKALDTFTHPEADRKLVWDLAGGAGLTREHLAAIDDVERRELVSRCLDRYEARTVPRLGELRASVIHNDANDANLLLRSVVPGTDEAMAPRISGLIDFGDMVHSWTVAELAVACAYAAMRSSDPVGVCARIARGYHTAYPLREPEIDALFDLVRLRLCLSVVVSAVRAEHEPTNEYLLVSQKAAWELLRRFEAEPGPDLASYRLRDACGFDPCPAGARLSAWLPAGRDIALPVVKTEPDGPEPIAFDLSVASAEAGGTDAPGDMEAWARAVFRRLEDAGADLGIGRYDEVRWCYTSEAFRTEADARPEWRTVHIGLDLFQPPGSPVYAPLPGVVHSFADNADRLDYGPTIILEHEVDDSEIRGSTGEAGVDSATGPLRFWTLYGHLSRDSLEGLSEGKRFESGEVVGYMGDRPVNGDWPPHLHFQLIADLLDYRGTFPGVAAPSQREVWLSLSPDPNALLGIPRPTRAPRPASPATLIHARARQLGPSLSLSYREPLHIVRGRGSYLYDTDGQPFLDCVNNVAHVGHSHPRVVDAIRRQAAVLNTNTRYLHEQILRYGERLTELLPDPLRVCFFVCSGSEANELALRMARAHTGGDQVIVVEGAYHGNTRALVEISPYKFDGPGGEGAAPHVRVVPMPDLYRGRYRGNDPEAAHRYAAHVREAAEELAGRGLAGFVCESLLGCGGQIPLPAGYLAASFDGVRGAGGVCIADEVQVGFGRVGSHFWAFETQGVVPDIVTLGKPIGNGHPIGAVVTTPEIAASFDTGMEYFNTFGGNPVSCAAALAVLDVIRDEDLQKRAGRVGAHLADELTGLVKAHSVIGDVRGKGLFLGIELVRDRETRQPAPRHAALAVERMRQRGILLSTDGPDHNVIKIKPPLVFSDADADHLVTTLDRVLAEDTFRI